MRIFPVKWVVAWLAILIFCLAGMRAFGAVPAATVTAYDAAKRVQLIEWVEQLRVAAGEAGAALATSEVQRAAASAAVVALQGDIDRLTAWGVAQQARADGQEARAVKAERAEAAAMAKYHAIKLYVGGALACGAGLLLMLAIFRYAAPALNTVPGLVLAFGAPVAAGAAVFTFIWLKL